MQGLETKNRWNGKKAGLALVGMLLLAWMLSGCSAGNSNKDGGAADTANGNSNTMMKESASMAAATDDATANAPAALVNSAQSSSADEAKSDGANAAVPQGSAEAATGAAYSPAADIADQGFDRKIVYRGNVTMEVKAYDEAQTALRDLIHLSGGYLLNFADQKTAAERGGTYTIKIPASGFDGFLNGLEKIDHVSYQSSAKGTDVTEEYVDLQARLKARQVVETRLLDFMAKATKTADLLQISSQLGDVQTEIEQIKGRIRYLDNNVAFSTIDLRVYETLKAVEPASVAKQDLGHRISDAASSSTEVMYAFLKGLIVVIAGALPVLAVLAVIGIPVYAFYRNVNRKRILERRTPVPKLPAPIAGEPTTAAAAADDEETSDGGEANK
ncbi:DUF4349 domain-containing protein [Paenibacillus rhizovicinus]|uniref:DUF4349 domain-containing protein n=1 Tax=Paenibacillus rhizovicinus TaxID=2704463 RepID=A0A6C0NW61_9BACL|nr:DUF4349 domain-containing protein [Paenibacillus rhizovicinus]QHW30388.1 DUF4349 domain-containing protein [Paenibacillus rhizovicinus]